MLLRLMGRPEDDFELVADRAGHDQRYAIESGKLRSSSAGSRGTATSSRAWPTPSPGTPTTATGGVPHKPATEAAYAAKGQ